MVLINSWILKKACKGLFHRLRSIAASTRSMGVHTPPTTCRPATSTAPTGHPRGPGAELSLTRKTTTQVVQTSCRLLARSARKLSALCSKRLHNVRNIAIITMKVTVTPTPISQVLDWIAQGNYVFVRN
jgi:hypothetical protein